MGIQLICQLKADPTLFFVFEPCQTRFEIKVWYQFDTKLWSGNRTLDGGRSLFTIKKWLQSSKRPSTKFRHPEGFKS
jgi:hypothetical protein